MTIATRAEQACDGTYMRLEEHRISHAPVWPAILFYLACERAPADQSFRRASRPRARQEQAETARRYAGLYDLIACIVAAWTLATDVRATSSDCAASAAC